MFVCVCVCVCVHVCVHVCVLCVEVEYTKLMFEHDCFCCSVCIHIIHAGIVLYLHKYHVRVMYRTIGNLYKGRTIIILLLCLKHVFTCVLCNF